MIHWVCTRDRGRLELRDDRLRCPDCDHEVRRVDGIPVFSVDEPRPAPIVSELLRLVERLGLEPAASRFCATHGCAREAPAADWPGIVPVPEGGRVLEIGPGLGEDAVLLAQRAAEVCCLVPSADHGRLVRRRLEEATLDTVAIAVCDDLRRLPLGDGSIDTLVMEGSAAAAFGWTGARLEATCAEWARVLKPTGWIALGMAGGARGLTTRLTGSGPESLERRLRRASGGDDDRTPPLRKLLRALRRQGFPKRRLYAPLPDPGGVEVVVPIEDEGVLRYFLRQMLRRNSPTARLALRAADAAVGWNLMRAVVPYTYVLVEPRDG